MPASAGFQPQSGKPNTRSTSELVCALIAWVFSNYSIVGCFGLIFALWWTKRIFENGDFHPLSPLNIFNSCPFLLFYPRQVPGTCIIRYLVHLSDGWFILSVWCLKELPQFNSLRPGYAYMLQYLTEWVMIVCGSGFSPVWYQAITSTKADLHHLGPQEHIFSEIWIQMWYHLLTNGTWKYHV